MKKNIKSILKRNMSTILTGIGVISLGATIYSTITETIKANEILKNSDEDLTRTEKLINLLPQYKKTIIFAATTIACMISSNILSVKQQKQLLSSYILLQQSYKAFKDKARELYGDEGVRDIYKAVMSEKQPPHDVESILFYDAYSGKYFDATEAEVLKAEMHINKKYAEYGYVDVNEFYKQLGDNLGIKNGDEYGWSAYYDTNETIWINFTHELCVMADGLECYIIHMDVEPMHCLSSGVTH